MKEINREEQQNYVTEVEALAGDGVTSASAIAKDLMDPTASDSLEVETNGEFLYNEKQRNTGSANTHPWHGWGTASVSGRSDYGGAVRTVLLSGSHAELRALDVDSTITADDINAEYNINAGQDITAGHDVTVGHNLYVKNDAGIKGTLVISENADDPGYLDDISDDTGLYIDETKEENHIHNLEVVNLTASKADFDSGSFGDLEARDLRVTQSLQVSGSAVLSGSTEVTGNFSVSGSAVFEEDVYVGRNLYVEGSASYINTDQLYIEDKSITVASGAISPEAANGAGFDIDGAGVEFHYNAHTDQMELNKGLFVDGNISASGVVVVPSGSIDDLVSNHTVTTELTASYAQFNSASGYFTGSFSGDGSGLTGVTMSVSDAPKCKHVINIEEGGGTEVITHPFNTQNVLVQVYRWADPTFEPEYQVPEYEEGIHAGGEDEVPAEVWDEPAIQVFDAEIKVRPVSTADPQNPYCVEITYPRELHGYVVIADAGLYVSGSGFVDVVEATREVIWFGSNPSGPDNPDNISYIPHNGADSSYPEIYKGDSYTFQHGLATEDILVQVYRYYPTYNPNTQEITGWVPVKYEPEYVAINSRHQIEVMFSKASELDSSFENGVQEEEVPLENYFGYIVIAKAGSVIKSFQISQEDIEYFKIHWGDEGENWKAKKFTADQFDATTVITDELSAQRAAVSEYIDTPKIGNLNTGEQYYENYYYDTPNFEEWYTVHQSDENIRNLSREQAFEYWEKHVTNGVWGTYIEFTDRSIDSYLFEPESRTSFTASSLRNNGDLYLAGSLVTNHSSFTLSDEREKDNIQTLTGSLENLMKLRGVSFEWHDGTKSIGTIAQEVRSIYPELTKVIENMEGEERISVNYEGLTGVLIEAVKTLANKVESLTQRIEQLEKNENR